MKIFKFFILNLSIILILSFYSTYSYPYNLNNDFNPIEKKIQNILNEVQKSLRKKNEGKFTGWTIEHQPLHKEVIRYLIFCIPKTRDLKDILLCKRPDSFYKILNDRNLGIILNKSDIESDIVINRILEKTDEMKIYNDYIKNKIPNNPTIQDLKSIELSYIHMFHADEIIKDRLLNLSQCTGAARLFMYYAQSQGLEVRYVYSVDLEQYKQACPNMGKPEYRPIYFNCEKDDCDSKMIETDNIGEIVLHGHQAVAIKSPNSSRWRILNTSDKTIDWATTDAEGKHIYEKNSVNELLSASSKIQRIYYRFYKNNTIITSNPHFVTFVGDDIAFNHEQLMCIYTRGDINGEIKCKWQIGE